VKQEATTRDLFQLILSSPQTVLENVGGEANYRALLRRIAADPPFTSVTPQIAQTPFLIAYTLTGNGEKKEASNSSSSVAGATYELAKAADIYIVDNSFLARMFSRTKRAPHESDLEELYVLLGSQYISKAVSRRFELVGHPSSDTDLTNALKRRILERIPLLVSPNVTSRPLVTNASSLFSEKTLTVLEAEKLLAVYSLDGISRRNPTTGFSKSDPNPSIVIVKDFDWFDVGYAVGDLILKRCQLEDAFFISSLLEAPVEQLRARGFPVDRILKPQPVAPPPPPPVAPSAATRNPNDSTSKSENGNRSTRATMASSTEAGPPGNGPQQTIAHDVPSVEHFFDTLKQMYPDADEEYIRSRLGSTPSLDTVRQLAEEMASGDYPRGKNSPTDADTVASSIGTESEQTDAESPKKNKKGIRKKLGRALHSLRPSNLGGSAASSPPPLADNAGSAGGSGAGAGTMAAPGTSVQHESTEPVHAAADAQSHSNLESMLEQKAKSTSKVGAAPHSVDSHLTATIPEGLDRGQTCEMVPGQSLLPYRGPRGDGQTRHGIRLFSTRNRPESEEFLRQNPDVVDSFSLVLDRLCSVYDLKPSSVGIFHGPAGGTIAFNAGSLYFNIRFFHALHWRSSVPATASSSSDCYSYWFVTFAHELAHNLVSAHNKEHGFYTESYVTMYLPKLLQLLRSLS